MARWEYLQIMRDSNEQLTVFGPDGSEDVRDGYTETVALVNQLGAEGWELVGSDNTMYISGDVHRTWGASTRRLWMKRQVPSDTA